MAIPVIPYGTMTSEQMNPYATAMSSLNTAIQGRIQNQYLPATLAAALMHANMQNQMQAQEIPYAQQFAQAKLSQAQVEAPYKQAMIQEIMQGKIPESQAMAYLYGQEGNKTQQMLPYQVQEQQGKVYQDPILQRLFEASMANKTGQIPSQLLASAGIPTQNQINSQVSPGMPNLGSVISSGMQNKPKQLLPVPNVNPATAPKVFGGDQFQNWALFGSPINPIEMANIKSGAETAGKTGVTNWNDAMSKADQDSDLGNQMELASKQFQDAYNKSTYKGSSLGTLPTTGIKSSIIPGNLSNEQAADNASQTLAGLRAKLIAGGRVTNYELQYVQNMKPNRAMTPQTAQMTSDFLIQRSRQMQQLPQFLKAAQDDGIDLRTAQNLWNLYRQQRPVYNFQTRQPYTQFEGSWRDFLNPDAINSVQTGEQYLNVPTFKNQKDLINWVKTLPQDSQNLFYQEYPRVKK